MSQEEEKSTLDSGRSKATADANLRALSLLTLTHTTALLPPERFPGDQPGEITEIRSINNTVVVLVSNGGHTEARTYDATGQVTTISLDPSFAEFATAHPDSYINVRRAGTDSNKAAFKKLGFSDAEILELDTSFIAAANDVPTSRSSYNSSSQELTDSSTVAKQSGHIVSPDAWKIEVQKHPEEGRVFIVTTGKSRFIIRPTDPSEKKAVKGALATELQIIENQLTPNLSLRTRENIIEITNPQGEVLSSYSGTKPVRNPTSPDTLYFISPEGQINTLDISQAATRTSDPTPQPQFQLEKPAEIQIDPNGNFLVARTLDQNLHIVDITTGQEAAVFDQVKGPFTLDSQGDILFVDTQNRLREIQTNFLATPNGGDKESLVKKQAALTQLQEKFARLKLGDQAQEEGITNESVAQTLRQTIAEQVNDKLAKATSPETVELILDDLQAIKARPELHGFTQVVDEFTEKAEQTLSSLKTHHLENQVNGLESRLVAVSSVGDTLGLDRDFLTILNLRRDLNITNPEQRAKLDTQLKQLEQRKEEIVKKYQEELIQAVSESLPNIGEVVSQTGSLNETSAFLSSPEAKHIEQMIHSIRDPAIRQELMQKYQTIITEQRQRILARTEALEAQTRTRYAEIIAQSRQELQTLQNRIEQITSTQELNRMQRDPEVIALRAKLLSLPDELRQPEETRLDILLSIRRQTLDNRNRLGQTSTDGSSVTIGHTTFPVFKETPVVWQPTFTPGSGFWSPLAFEDSRGRVWKPHTDRDVMVTPDLQNPQTQALIEKYSLEARAYFEGQTRNIPDFDPKWRLTEYHKMLLEKILQTLNFQLLHHSGILILQGDAGTGKNVLIDMIAALTRREIFTVPCNVHTAKEDLQFEYGYNPEKGTYRLPSQLVEGIQTPGAIVFWDEINALHPGVAKLHNPLFDYRRRMIFTEGSLKKTIQAEPTVLFIGSMNRSPNYLGTSPLSPEIKSRARFENIGYPPFENPRGGFFSHEAEILAPHTDSMATLTESEVRACWNQTFNNQETATASSILATNPEIARDLSQIHEVLRAANRLREMYNAYQQGESTEPITQPVSLRETTDIILELNDRDAAVVDIVERIILPKIDDPSEARLVKASIEAELGPRTSRRRSS